MRPQQDAYVAEGNRTVRSRFADQLRRRQSDRLQGSGLWTIAGPRTHPYRGSHDPLGGGIHVGRRGYGRSHTREEQRPLRPACDAAHRDQRPGADAGHPGLAMGHDGDACSGSRHRVRLCHSASAHQRRAHVYRRIYRLQDD